MSVITSVSIKNADWDYIREKGISPTAMFNLGLAKQKRMDNVITDDDGVGCQDPEELNNKVNKLIGANTILNEHIQRLEFQLQQEREYRRGNNGN